MGLRKYVFRISKVLFLFRVFFFSPLKMAGNDNNIIYTLIQFMSYFSNGLVETTNYFSRIMVSPSPGEMDSMDSRAPVKPKVKRMREAQLMRIW